jgi:hypothetical protein
MCATSKPPATLALARAAEAEREATAAQTERNAADARFRAARERVAANLPPPSAHDDDNASFASADDPLRDALAQNEAQALLNLHSQAVAV